MRSNMLLFGVATATLLGSAPMVLAQPGTVRVERRGHVPPPGGPGGPMEAPPPVRFERAAPRPGFEWIPGRWDWRGGRWEWMAGRYEPEHHGQHWNPGHWDHAGAGWVWTEGGYVDGGLNVGVTIGGPPPGGPGVVVATMPNVPPPPPQVERWSPRPGFEWIPGRWDWRHGRYIWIAGRYEAEHPGQHWNPGRWVQNGPQWTWNEGAYVEAAMPQPQPPPPPPMAEIPPPHEWHFDRPEVSSYWPAKGKAGTRVVIRGENFPPDTQVMWGPDPVAAAKIEPNKIVFEVPPAAQSATILLKRGGNRDLIVGNFEVAAYDALAEERALEAERMAAAQAAWQATQARLAKDEAARQAQIDAEWAQMEANREQRRAARIAEIRAQWNAAFLADPDTQAELALHARRVAELERAKDVASVTANTKLGVRIDVATARENDRHAQRMAALQTAFNARGGTP
jgi:hypothetical protein